MKKLSAILFIVISFIGAVISFSGATAHKGDNSENTLPADSFISHCSPYSDSGDLSLFTIPANAFTGSTGGQRTPTRLTYSSRTSRTSGRTASAAIAGCSSAVGYMTFSGYHIFIVSQKNPSHRSLPFLKAFRL